MRLVSSAQARAPQEKLTLANGIPVTIALQYSTGKQVPSRIPGAADQMYYTLTDGRGVYLPLEVAGLIDELQLNSREPFTICKYGPREWQVKRINPHGNAPAADALKQPAAGAPAPLPPAAPVSSPPRKEPAAGASFDHSETRPVNGQGEDLPAILARCYADAIDVTVAAIDAARAKGLHFAPTHEALQAAAATLFIAHQRRQP